MKDKIAVITPYYKEPVEIFWKAHQSVKNQGLDIIHIMVSDGHPNSEVDKWDVQHAILPKSHNDNGNTPRGIGSILACAQNCSYIGYLDADNWFLNDHISSLHTLQRLTNTPVSASLRHFFAVDGSPLRGVVESDEDNHSHIDTSCYLIHQSGFGSLSMWTQMPRQLSPICDRVFYAGLKHRGLKISFSDKRTVAFRSQYEVHYRAAGLAPGFECKTNVADAAMKWVSTFDGVRETVNRLGFFPF